MRRRLVLEGLVGVIAGVVAGSISLVGFGIDSFIEVASGSTLLWKHAVHTLAVDLKTHHVYTPEQEENGKPFARMVVYEAVTNR